MVVFLYVFAHVCVCARACNLFYFCVYECFACIVYLYSTCVTGTSGRSKRALCPWNTMALRRHVSHIFLKIASRTCGAPSLFNVQLPRVRLMNLFVISCWHVMFLLWSITPLCVFHCYFFDAGMWCKLYLMNEWNTGLINQLPKQNHPCRWLGAAQKFGAVPALMNTELGARAPSGHLLLPL